MCNENKKKQNAVLTLPDGREIEVEISEEELKKFEVKKNPFEIQNGFHHFINAEGNADALRDFNKSLYESGNYFNNHEFASLCARGDRFIRKLRKFAIENNTEIQSSNNKFIIAFYRNEPKAVVKTETFGTVGNVVFSSREICDKAIEKFKDELYWYFENYTKIYE